MTAHRSEPISPRPRPARMALRVGRVLASALVSAALAFVPAAHVVACSCAQSTPAMALANSDAAFVGVVSRVQDNVDAGKGVGQIVASITYGIVVEEALKGGWSAGEVAQVDSEAGTCSVFFAVGQRWRVYTYLDGPRHLTSICSGNELLAEGVPIPAPTDAPGGGIPMGLLVVLGSTALVGAISIWAFTRREHSPSA